MKIFVLNCGSSSIKYKLFSYHDRLEVIAQGMVEKIGESYSLLMLNDFTKKIECANHKEALQWIEKELLETKILTDFSTLSVIAHRVVHGGSVFVKPTIIDDEVIFQIREMIPLAPLHNPANLEGIIAMRHLVPTLPQIAFFDTAFHQAMPTISYLYALPKSISETMQIRRYGFHGISYAYLLIETATFLKKPADRCNLIILHLGNGASAVAIKNGKSIDTSMGFTPLEGLVMGTRSGDIDVGILLYLAKEKHYNIEQFDSLLNHESGLKGLCGTNDMREILARIQRDDGDAKLAFEIFIQRIKKYIGAYIALLGEVDAIVFSGGIGANSPKVRAHICDNMVHMGIQLDSKENEKNSLLISGQSALKVLTMQTDEELEMARKTLTILS